MNPGCELATLSFDGSSHDAHQHYSLIEACDNKYLDCITQCLTSVGYASDIASVVS